LLHLPGLTPADEGRTLTLYPDTKPGDPQSDDALTIKPDHSVGADQNHALRESPLDSKQPKTTLCNHFADYGDTYDYLNRGQTNIQHTM
jgi:hypothetical protein